MPISAKWKHKSSIHIGFIVFNGGVTTFFAKSVYTGPTPNSGNKQDTVTEESNLPSTQYDILADRITNYNAPFIEIQP